MSVLDKEMDAKWKHVSYNWYCCNLLGIKDKEQGHKACFDDNLNKNPVEIVHYVCFT
jgi:hypothetical protein